MRGNRNMVLARDEGLRRARTWGRGVFVAGLALAGICTAAVANALPGRSAHAHTTAPVQQPTQPAGSGTSTNPSSGQPAAPPAPAYQPPVTSSGGS